MLTIEEIKNELGAGNTVDLECIDVDSLLLSEKRQSYRDINEEMLKSENLIVTGVYEDGTSKLLSINDDTYRLLPREIKYFRIKRPSPTFSDLIDLAADAIKKKLIVNLYIGPHYIEFDSNGHSHAYDMQEAKRGIDFINSLYTETFVIESERDCKRIKQDAKITFLNGNSVVMDQPPCDAGIVRIWNDGRYDFTVLQGATVTQKRGSV